MQTKPAWRMKTWWAALIPVIIGLLNQFLGWNINIADLYLTYGVFATFIIGEVARDVARIKNPIVQEAVAAAQTALEACAPEPLPSNVTPIR